MGRLTAAVLATTVFISGCTKNTPATQPKEDLMVSTLAATSVSYTGATAGGVVKAGTDTSAAKGICYGISPLPTIADSVLTATSATDSFHFTLKGLVPNTGYAVRAFLKTPAGVTYGNQILFQTAGGVKTASTASRIYLSGSNINEVFALDPATGKIIWRRKLNSGLTSATYSSGKVLVRDNTNLITALDTFGNVSWTRKLDGSSAGESHIPMVAGKGILYTRDPDYTYAFYATDGSLKWRTANPDPSMGQGYLTLSGNKLYARATYGGLTLMDTETGSVTWSLSYYPGALAILPNSIYLFNELEYGTSIQSIDGRTGNQNWISKEFPFRAEAEMNVGYGRIYDVLGWVMDTTGISTTHATMLPPMQYYTGTTTDGWSWPPGSTFPILADGLAIIPPGICDAFTGERICTPTGVRLPGFGGITYLNQVVYYTTGQEDIYDPYTGGHLYTHIYAYDVINKTQLWDTRVENADFSVSEPCVVDANGTGYRGSNTFR